MKRTGNHHSHFSVLVTEKSRRKRYNAKFRTTVVDLLFALTPSVPQSNFSVVDIIDGIRDAITFIIDSSLEHIAADDKVRLVLDHKDLDKPISIPMIKRSLLTPDLLCERIMKVAQSKKELLFHGLLNLNVLSTSLPRGGGINGKRSKDSVIDFTDWRKNSQCVIRIKSDGSDCLARAICVSRAKIDGLEGIEWRRLRENKFGHLDKAAYELCKSSGVVQRQDGATYDDLIQFQEFLKPHYQLIVVTPEGGKDLFFRGSVAADKQIFIVYHNNHYDSLTSIRAFLKTDYWCRHCLKGFNDKGDHKCKFTCSRCFGSETCSPEDEITCRECKRTFVSSDCLKRHLIETKVCSRYYYCVSCDSEFSKRSKHVCQHYYCKTCSKNVHFGHHQCYMEPMLMTKLINEDQEPRVHVFYDIESMLVPKSVSEIDHLPNLVVAKTCCSFCWSRMEEYPLPEGCKLCGQRNMTFYGSLAIKKFAEWLFGIYEYVLQKNSKSLGLKQIVDCIVFAHNARSYDSIFVMKYLLESRRTPKPIKRGQKILTMRVGRYKFLDSIAFLTMPLRNFADTFGLPSGKGLFPYLMNTPENQSYVGSWPDKYLYSPNDMKGKTLEIFNKWYEQQTNKTFNLKEELIKYCDQDVTVLMNGVQVFRKLLIDTTGMDPFTRNITLSSFVMHVFRTSYLPRNTLAIPPTIGYEPKRQQSHIATVWLDYLEQTGNIKINREVQLGCYYADGYHPETRRVYEFFGCYFHGCPKCFPTKRNIIKNTISGLSMSQLHAGVEKKMAFYEKNYWDVTTIFECELKAQLAACQEMLSFFKKRHDIIRKPLSSRDAYYGGRVETLKFLHESSFGEKIMYYDINSLYPYILKSRPFPKGHPEIIYDHFKNLDQYEGIINAQITPPRNLRHPLLPSHINGKLMYVLCNKCAEITSEARCEHTDDERTLSGTWVIVEVKKALELGYVLKQIFCIWHYKEIALSNDGQNVYKEFINKWMKIKLQASGWPKENMTSEDKKAHMANIARFEGISMEEDKICKRKDLRTIGKLCANSFYGKMAERTIKSKTKFIKEPYEYFEIQDDHSIDSIDDVFLVNDEVLQVTFTPRSEFVDPPPHAAVIQACYVTAYSRLHLYSYLEQLQERVFYMDTDSVIFSYKPDEVLPETGMLIGQMSDEIKDDYGEQAFIKRFCSIGCKSYCLDIEDGSSMSKYVNKFKGITCGFATACLINFKSILDIVYDKCKSYQVPQKRFKIAKEYTISTQSFEKKLQFTFDKRRIINEFETEPFGY